MPAGQNREFIENRHPPFQKHDVAALKHGTYSERVIAANIKAVAAGLYRWMLEHLEPDAHNIDLMLGAGRAAGLLPKYEGASPTRADTRHTPRSAPHCDDR